MYSFSQLNWQGLAPSSCPIYTIFFLPDFNFRQDSKNNWLVSASENFSLCKISRLSARIFYIQTGILAIWYVVRVHALHRFLAIETATARLTKELWAQSRQLNRQFEHKLEDGACILYIIRTSGVMPEQRCLILGPVNNNSSRLCILNIIKKAWRSRLTNNKNYLLFCVLSF